MLQYVCAQLTVLYILRVHQRHDNEQLLKQRVLLELVYLRYDLLRQLLTYVIEAEGAGEPAINIARQLITQDDHR